MAKQFIIRTGIKRTYKSYTCHWFFFEISIHKDVYSLPSQDLVMWSETVGLRTRPV